jgi:branched-subunit amino acid aminotransferase/4-amino-4-deoxychorismate lyase
MSVFETLRIFNGSPGFLAPHLKRLRSAALTCGFHTPEESLSALPKLLGSLQGTGVARVYITAGDGAPDAPAGASRLIVLFEPREPALRAAYSVRTSTAFHVPPFGGLKTGNYWNNLEALREARSLGADESLLFRPDGLLLGAAMANVFVKIHGVWITPGLQSGTRDGVVRAWTMDKLPVQEAPVSRPQLEQAESMFLTSSWIGLMPVTQLDGKTLQPALEIAGLNPL